MTFDTNTWILIAIGVLQAITMFLQGRLKTPIPVTPVPGPTPGPTPTPGPADPSLLPNGLPFNGLFLKLLLEFLAGRRVLINAQAEDGKVQTFGLEVVENPK